MVKVKSQEQQDYVKKTNNSCDERELPGSSRVTSATLIALFNGP